MKDLITKFKALGKMKVAQDPPVPTWCDEKNQLDSRTRETKHLAREATSS